MEFGPRFLELLQANNISQSKFAEDTGLHKGLVSRVVNGEKPSSSFIFKAVEYFEDVDLKYLFSLNEENLVNESDLNYVKNDQPLGIIEEIEIKLKKLKSVLPQK